MHSLQPHLVFYCYWIDKQQIDEQAVGAQKNKQKQEAITIQTIIKLKHKYKKKKKKKKKNVFFPSSGRNYIYPGSSSLHRLSFLSKVLSVH